MNATAPEPVTNRTFSKALGHALHRPAVAPIPGAAIRLLYGDMAEIVTKGQRVVPKRTVELGYTYQHPDLDEALNAAVGKANQTVRPKTTSERRSSHHWGSKHGRSPSGPRPPGPRADARHRACRHAARTRQRTADGG